MSKPKTLTFKDMRIRMSKEQSEMLVYLTEHYQEPATHVVKKALERLYRVLKTKNEKENTNVD